MATVARRAGAVTPTAISGLANAGMPLVAIGVDTTADNPLPKPGPPLPDTEPIPNAYGSGGDGLGVQVPLGGPLTAGVTGVAIGEKRLGARLN